MKRKFLAVIAFIFFFVVAFALLSYNPTRDIKNSQAIRIIHQVYRST